MDYLHSLHYLHRDLTSKNVFIRKLAPIPSDDCEEPQLVAVIGDFGFAAIEPTIDHKLPTVGSPYWLAPECIKGQWFVFFLAIILFKFLNFFESFRKTNIFLS
jgi:serine/threonine protein kinase